MRRHRHLDNSTDGRCLRRTLVYATAAAVLVAAAAITTGCVGREGEGRFEVSGIRKYNDCLERTFPLVPEFMSTGERIDSVGIFLQTKAQLSPAGDLVYIEVFEDVDVGGDTAESFTFDNRPALEPNFPPEPTPPVRIKVAPWESCPDSTISLAVEGTVRFDSFGVDSSDRMVGELTEGTIVDATSGEVVAESLTGFWDFAVQVAAPYRAYPNVRDEYKSGVEPER